jgi:hypothetical protein
MGSEHTYRAGEWLGERVIAPGTYFLTGVVPDIGVCSGHDTLLISACKPVADPQPLYARIVMPKPKKFFNLGHVHLGPSELQADSSIQLSSYVLSTVQVLTYAIFHDDPRNVKLGCHWFTKSAQQFGNDLYMSLHIFSAPDRPELPSHVQSGFETLVGMGEGLSGRIALNSAQPVPDPASDLKNIPPGLIPAELRSLSRRMDRLTDIGRLLRSWHVDDNDVRSLPTTSFIGVDGDIPTCTNYGVVTGD